MSSWKKWSLQTLDENKLCQSFDSSPVLETNKNTSAEKMSRMFHKERKCFHWIARQRTSRQILLSNWNSTTFHVCQVETRDSHDARWVQRHIKYRRSVERHLSIHFSSHMSDSQNLEKHYVESQNSVHCIQAFKEKQSKVRCHIPPKTMAKSTWSFSSIRTLLK